MLILDKVDDPDTRLWYAHATTEHGWSRNVLAFQVDSQLHLRQGAAVSSFQKALPAPQSELVQQMIKDPYNFEFVPYRDALRERHVEEALTTATGKMLMELGKGFAFVGSQYPLEVGGQEFFVDLLLFNYILNCFVVVELKIGAFEPEFAGKMNFYLAAVDDLVREQNHQPSIGLILCRERNKAVVEYTLRGVDAPMAVAKYELGPEVDEALDGDIVDED